MKTKSELDQGIVWDTYQNKNIAKKKNHLQSLCANFDSNGIHFLPTRGESWEEKTLIVAHLSTHDLWRYRWEGPTDSNIGEDPLCWEHLSPIEIKIHEHKAMSIG